MAFEHVTMVLLYLALPTLEFVVRREDRDQTAMRMRPRGRALEETRRPACNDVRLRVRVDACTQS